MSGKQKGGARRSRLAHTTRRIENILNKCKYFCENIEDLRVVLNKVGASRLFNTDGERTKQRRAMLDDIHGTCQVLRERTESVTGKKGLYGDALLNADIEAETQGLYAKLPTTLAERQKDRVIASRLLSEERNIAEANQFRLALSAMISSQKSDGNVDVPQSLGFAARNALKRFGTDEQRRVFWGTPSMKRKNWAIVDTSKERKKQRKRCEAFLCFTINHACAQLTKDPNYKPQIPAALAEERKRMVIGIDGKRPNVVMMDETDPLAPYAMSINLLPSQKIHPEEILKQATRILKNQTNQEPINLKKETEQYRKVLHFAKFG